jgi:NAD(P)-dependent dehydrogenase (short-subunit alcohol dehydrogenase family)
MSRDVAVVFGGAGEGSGQAISRRFAREMHVVVADRDDMRASTVAQSIVLAGGSAEAIVVDIRDSSSVASVLHFASSPGPLRAVVNNASAVDAYDANAPLEQWEQFIDVDFKGTAQTTRLAIDALRTGGGGAIVNVSSTSALALKREGGSPMYDACKAAVLLLSLRLGFLGRENVRVNCIVPHWIAVPHIVEFVRGLSAEERTAYGVPDRLIPVEEIAETVYSIATDRAQAGVAVIWPNGEAPRNLSLADFC